MFTLLKDEAQAQKIYQNLKDMGLEAYLAETDGSIGGGVRGKFVVKDIEQDYITIIGGNLISPIVKLLEALESSGVRSVNDVQTSPFENGYSAAIILLAIVSLESKINRISCITNSESKEERALSFFNNKFPDSRLNDKLLELFVVRDVIAHNHVWEAKVRCDENDDLKLVSAFLRDGYGDTKYRKAIDKNSRKTKLLKINLFSTRICWADVIIVLKTFVETLLFLEDKNRSYSYISNDYVEFKGESIKFVDLVIRLV